MSANHLAKIVPHSHAAIPATREADAEPKANAETPPPAISEGDSYVAGPKHPSFGASYIQNLSKADPQTRENMKTRAIQTCLTAVQTKIEIAKHSEGAKRVDEFDDAEMTMHWLLDASRDPMMKSGNRAMIQGMAKYLNQELKASGYREMLDVDKKPISTKRSQTEIGIALNSLDRDPDLKLLRIAYERANAAGFPKQETAKHDKPKQIDVGSHGKNPHPPRAIASVKPKHHIKELTPENSAKHSRAKRIDADSERKNPHAPQPIASVKPKHHIKELTPENSAKHSKAKRIDADNQRKNPHAPQSIASIKPKHHIKEIRPENAPKYPKRIGNRNS